MNKKTLSVSIGIPAYNEEGNIKNLLLSILSQKEEGFYLKEIIVVSDGSIDNTVSLAKSIKNSKILVIDHKDRKGQSIRQSELVSIVKGEIVAFFEADTIIKDKYYLKKLTNAFQTNKYLHVVYGKTVSLKGKNLFERIIVFAEEHKLKIFNQINKGNNLYTFHYGKILNRKLLKKFKWPSDVPEDSYLYIYSKLNNLTIYYNKNAVIYYRCQSNMLDYLKKTIRFNKGKERLRRYFPQQTIDKFYKIPNNYLSKFMISCLKESLAYTILYLLFFTISKMAYIFSPKYNQLWNISKSTKKLTY